MGTQSSSTKTGMKAGAAALAALVMLVGAVVMGSDNPKPTATDCIPTR